MKKLGLILLFVFCGVTLAQSTTKDSIVSNVVDAEGRKQGRWVIFNKMKKPPLPEFTDEQKVEEGKYLDDKKIGKWITYYPNGNRKSVITFESNRPNGYATIFHENGKILEEGFWKNNKWVGDYKSYHENGVVQHEFKFNEFGKRSGNQKYSNEEGVVIIEGEMKSGKEVGKWVERYDNGDLKAEKVFNEGTIDDANTKVFEPKKPLEAKPVEALTDDAPAKTAVVVDKTVEKTNVASTAGKEPFSGNGEAKLYNKNKQVSKDGFFKNFRLITGKAYFYDENGILQRIAVYENGKYIGDAPTPVE